MTPLARRVMEKVRQKDHGTYERWIGAIVDATLDEAAQFVARQPSPSSFWISENILSLKEPT